ncbi:MAG TPA: hypothetical protein VFK05_03870 [Polyangiaceae bacterium]|nr:hypothetical protein [Polyangiaceae bacterium]
MINARVRRIGFSVATLAAGAVATLAVERVRAAGAPAKNALVYTGYLELPDGSAVDGTRAIAISLFDAESNGNKVCEAASTSRTVARGRFQVTLPDACASAAQANSDLWIDVQVDGLSVGRSKLNAVPYALEAGRASSASGPLDARIAQLEAKPQTGYLKSPLWSHSYTASSGAPTNVLWSEPINVATPSVLLVSIDAHWSVNSNACFATVTIDGVPIGDAACATTGATATNGCWGASHTQSDTWVPVGYNASTTISSGSHALGILVAPTPGSTCAVNGARIYYTLIPR